MQLPKIKNNDQTLQLMQDRWMSILNPVLADPLLDNNIIQARLIIGTNTINHLLSRMQQGWIIVDQDAAAQIYRSQPFNNKTLTLTSNAAVNVSLVVF